MHTAQEPQVLTTAQSFNRPPGLTVQLLSLQVDSHRQMKLQTEALLLAKAPLGMVSVGGGGGGAGVPEPGRTGCCTSPSSVLLCPFVSYASVLGCCSP